MLDFESNRILLYFVVIINSMDVLEFLLCYFSCIDCSDNCGIIFVFLVVEYGFVDNLLLMVRRGVKINCKIKLLMFSDKFKEKDIFYDFFNLVFELKLKFWGFIMFYVVVYIGYLEVVNFFFDNGVFILIVNDVYFMVL